MVKYIVSLALFLAVFSVNGTFATQNYKEEMYNGFDVLRKVANNVLRREEFPALIRDRSLRKAVRPICPLVDSYLEIKQYIDSDKATNITELQAAELILGYILNDTCTWIESFPDMDHFNCSSENLTDLETLCIVIEIKDLADEQRDLLLGLYSNEDQVYRYSQSGSKEWIEEKFSGEDTSVIDTALLVIRKYAQFQSCSRNGQAVSCS